MKLQKNLSSGKLSANPVELSTGPIDQHDSEPASSDENTLRKVWKHSGDSPKRNSLHGSRRVMKNLAEELTTGPLSSMSQFSSSTSSVENRRTHCVESSSFQREGPEAHKKSEARKIAKGLNSVNPPRPTPFDTSTCDDAPFHSESRARNCSFRQQASNLTDKRVKNPMKLQGSSCSRFFRELLPTESSTSAESMILSPKKRVPKLQMTSSDTEVCESIAISDHSY